MKITKIDEIDFEHNEEVELEATFLAVIFAGNKEKNWPFKFSIKIESSGEIAEVTGWDYKLLNEINSAVSSLNVYNFVLSSGIYKDNKQLSLRSFKDLEKKSTIKILRESVTTDEIKTEFSTIVSTYLQNNPTLKKIVNDLIISNENFFVWPAATIIHHNYPGGLAIHSLSVCKNAIDIWERYKGENIKLEVLVAGALLHDIGKLSEYNKDGTRTIYGDLVSHIVDGSDRILKWALDNGKNPFNNIELTILRHIILSHHRKPEFGSPVVPGTIEALIVSYADDLDSKVEAVEVALRNLNEGAQSEKIFSIGNQFLKW